ncbi:MAG TPA: hypothetical protein VGS07_24790 [Thermoanaerobaculia bacterium]|nr:hypothetical protein [Thermoanaerobaculia bacterium]
MEHGDVVKPVGEHRRLSWTSLAVLLSLAVVAWEYLLYAAMNTVGWNLTGVAAHMALDVALVLPVMAVALGAGLRLARRFRMERGQWAGVLGIAGLVSLVFLVGMLPVLSTRDMVHEWMGNTYGLSLAQAPVGPVRSDGALKESRQLCSFGALSNPSLAGSLGGGQIPVLYRIQTGVNALLIQLAALLPLLLLALFARFRGELPRTDAARYLAVVRWWTRPLRLGSLVVVALLGFLYGSGITDTYAQTSVVANSGTHPFNACTDGGPVKSFDIHAINVDITLNRYFDHAPGFMYALSANIPAIRAFESALATTREALRAANDVNLAVPGGTRVTPGLRKDPIQPLVIRANLGDCVRIHFTNDITTDGQPASLSVLGLSHTVGNGGGRVGVNPATYALPGGSVNYEIPIPTDASAERAYSFSDHGSGNSNLNALGGQLAHNEFRERQGMGLFGALVVEPKGATYLDVEDGHPLDTVTGSSWEAIIIDPNLAHRPDGKNFREFIVMYHELGHENFRAAFDFTGVILPHLDTAAFSGVYRLGLRCINYRSEPFRRRIELNNIVNGPAGTIGNTNNGKPLGYSSYPFGDPATPMPRSYLGEATKTRIVHAGAEVFHVHHLHGGGIRWRRNPNADPNSNFWNGLTKVPEQTIKSVHLDSQSIGPGASYNLEHECGAGGCQQVAGDFLYHCHIGQHYVAGMWSFWRVFDTVQTAENDRQGHALYVEPRLYQSDNVFSDSEQPSNRPPVAGVSAGSLIGVQVDWNRTIVADASFTNPLTQVKLSDWVTGQLPPQGARLDTNDATVWDWTSTGSAATYKIFGEPEETRPMANFTSPTPGVRPELRFNARNGRYAWPPFRTHAAARPPFTPRHTGAPWLGEQMIPGRMDGLCANNFVHSGVDVGLKAQRFYPISAITLPIQVARATPPAVPGGAPAGLAGGIDPNGEIYVLNEHKADIRAGLKPAEPLAIRSNVGDCVEVILTNEIPDSALNNNFSKVNIHSHFVQFDTQASDGVITGYSYEQAVRPYATENRTLTTAANPLATTLKVTNVNRLRPGIWIGIGLGEGTCGSILGQPFPCTEIRKITSVTAPDTITVDLPLLLSHPAGQAVGVEFVRYDYYPDVDFGTVFFHQHVDFKDWDHGLFGAHIVEPKGSTYHDPITGAEIRAGALADIHVNPLFGGQPVAAGVNGSFREFMLFVHNENPVVGQFQFGGGTINLRAEPWSLRPGDPAYRFSSAVQGEPITPTVRAYAGDPVVFRGLGLIDKVGGIRVTGHRFNIERENASSDLRDTSFLGISERYDMSLEGGAGGPKKFPGDYMYYSTLTKDFQSGAWGLMRVFDQQQANLQSLPDKGYPHGTSGFPAITAGSGTPPSLTDGPGNACPTGATRRTYNLSIADTTIIYNDLLPTPATPGEAGTAYFLNGDPVTNTRTPMVIRANKGECLRVNLTNLRVTQHSGFSVGKLLFDPQRSYGSAIGLNYDSTVAPGATRTYEYYADKELGLSLALNLGDIDSVLKGGFGGVVVEPSGSSYRSPGTLSPLPGGGAGIQADIVQGGLASREVVSLITDNELNISQDHMPYPDANQSTTAESYSNEPWTLRNFVVDPANVYATALWGDPRHLVTVPQGASLIYRVGSVWGDMPHMPTLEGHRYVQEPGMSGSEVLYGDVVAPGMTLTMAYLGGAGGDLQATGDYLYYDRSLLYAQGGVWHIVRVTSATSGHLVATDNITITSAEAGRGKTTLRGVVSTKPAGDTVGSLALFDGGEAKGRCTGKSLGTVPVDRSSGHWQLDLGPQAAKQICLQSPAGGVVSASTADPVAERTRKMLASVQEVNRQKQLQLQFQKQFDELEKMEEDQ